MLYFLFTWNYILFGLRKQGFYPPPLPVSFRKYFSNFFLPPPPSSAAYVISERSHIKSC